MLKTLTTLLVVCALSLSGQNLNHQLNDSSILEFTNSTTGQKISFSVQEARSTFQQMFAETKPTRKENLGWPAYMREKMDWVHSKTYWSPHPKLPDNWSQGPIKNGDSEVYAELTYCVPRADLGQQPCIIVYVNVLMFTFRTEYPLYRTPPQTFKNTFAVILAHEAIHHERGKPYYFRTWGLEEQIAEETRALSKTIIDIVHPLKLANYALDNTFDEPEKILAKCGYKMPCKALSGYVRKIKTASKSGK